MVEVDGHGLACQGREIPCEPAVQAGDENVVVGRLFATVTQVVVEERKLNLVAVLGVEILVTEITVANTVALAVAAPPSVSPRPHGDGDGQAGRVLFQVPVCL